MTLADLDSAAPLLDADSAVVVAAELSADIALEAADRDAERMLPATQVDALSASGLLGITVPSTYGGPDLPAGTLTGDLESTGSSEGDVIANVDLIDQCGETVPLWDLAGEYHILFMTAAW